MTLRSWIKRNLQTSSPLWLRELFYRDLPNHVALIRNSGQFDEDYYRALYPGVCSDNQDPIRHYCLAGWRLGLNPCDDFDTSFYLSTYPDIREGGINPFLHYIQSGASELRLSKPSLRNSYEDDVWFGRFAVDVKPVAFYGEPDWKRFRHDQQTVLHHEEGIVPLHGQGFYDPTDPEVLRGQALLASSHGLHGFCFEMDPDLRDPQRRSAWQVFRDTPTIPFAYCLKLGLTSAPQGDGLWAEVAAALRDPRAIRIHGRPLLLLVLSADASAHGLATLRQNLATLASAHPFLMGSLQAAGAPPTQEVLSLLDGLLDQAEQPVPSETGSFKPLRKKGYELVPYKVVVSAGLQRLEADAPSLPQRFHGLTLGRHGAAEGSPIPMVYSRFQLADYRHWLEAVLTRLRRQDSLEDRLLFIKSWNNWNGGQVLEPDRLTGYSKLNTTTRTLLAMRQNQRLPKVSIIVPDLYRDRHLQRRLASIDGQIYRNCEVLLIGQPSSPTGRECLEAFIKANPQNTRRLLIDDHAMAEYHWSKALASARGELIWIAQAEDDCDLNFLETLVASFEDESVLLAYSAAHGVQQQSFSFVHTSHREVNASLGKLNAIAGLSSVVFRRPEPIPLLKDPTWLAMQFWGDWLFYLHMILGGKIAFHAQTLATVTGEGKNNNPLDPDYYRELGLVSKTVASLYDVPLALLEESREACHSTYRQTFGAAASDAEFETWFDHQAVLQARSSRKPHILVATMGFYPGGAEILPIRLANEFKRHGLAVTLLSVGLHVCQHGVRILLRNDIPVVETSSLEETRDLLRDFGIDVLNSHQWHVQRYPHLRPGIFADIAHVACLHGMIEHGNVNGVTRAELVEADQGVTTWIYTAEKNLTPFAENQLLANSHGRFLKLANGMEPPIIEPIPRQQMGIPQDAFVLCCVSRAIPEKGWDETIEVVRLARERTGKDIRLILVGNGIVHDQYRAMGAPEFVYLAGFHTNSVGHYAAADMGVMLTRFKSESFPLTIVDCLFAGKPYLATDVGEIRNILTWEGDVAGDVIPLDDWQVPIEQVADSLVEFVLDRDRYFRCCQLATSIANRYRIDVVAAQYLDIFTQDIKRNAAPRIAKNDADHITSAKPLRAF